MGHYTQDKTHILYSFGKSTKFEFGPEWTILIKYQEETTKNHVANMFEIIMSRPYIMDVFEQKLSFIYWFKLIVSDALNICKA